MFRTAAILVGITLAGACTADESEAAPPPVAKASAPSTATAASASASSTSDGGAAVKISNDLYEFDYSWPAQAGRHDGLRTILEQKRSDAEAELKAATVREKAAADEGGYFYRPHASGTEWKVVADTPRFLSLSAEVYSYTGGAHGMTNFDTILWDKQANTARQPVDLFESRENLRYAIREPFCEKLNVERAERRGGPVPENSDDSFDGCIDPTESTIILGSSNGKAFNRIGVLVEPYAAGSYAEGSYEVTLPVTDSLVDFVKIVYMDAFAPMR